MFGYLPFFPSQWSISLWSYFKNSGQTHLEKLIFLTICIRVSDSVSSRDILTVHIFTLILLIQNKGEAVGAWNYCFENSVVGCPDILFGTSRIWQSITAVKSCEKYINFSSYYRLHDCIWKFNWQSPFRWMVEQTRICTRKETSNTSMARGNKNNHIGL